MVLCPITNSSINTTEFWTKFLKVTFKKHQRILIFHLGPSIQTKCNYFAEVLFWKNKNKNKLCKRMATKGNSLLLFLERKKERKRKWRCSVMYNSLWSHGLQPTRFLCPWDFPGKNPGVGCHFFLQEIFPTQRLNLDLPIVGRRFTVWATLLGPLFLEVLWKRDLFLSSGKK